MILLLIEPVLIRHELSVGSIFGCYFLIQVMFENYQFEGVYIAIQAVLTLYAQGNVSIYMAL